VSVQKAPTVVKNYPATTEPVQRRNRTRTRTVNVPGQLLINERHVRPTVVTEQVNIKFAKQADQHTTAEPIVRKTIKTKTVERKYHDAVHTIPVERVVHVPTPVITRIPVYLGT